MWFAGQGQEIFRVSDDRRDLKDMGLCEVPMTDAAVTLINHGRVQRRIRNIPSRNVFSCAASLNVCRPIVKYDCRLFIPVLLLERQRASRLQAPIPGPQDVAIIYLFPSEGQVGHSDDLTIAQ